MQSLRNSFNCFEFSQIFVSFVFNFNVLCNSHHARFRRKHVISRLFWFLVWLFRPTNTIKTFKNIISWACAGSAVEHTTKNKSKKWREQNREMTFNQRKLNNFNRTQLSLTERGFCNLTCVKIPQPKWLLNYKVNPLKSKVCNTNSPRGHFKTLQDFKAIRVLLHSYNLLICYILQIRTANFTGITLIYDL